jgi:hypothetical protein
MAKSGPGSWVIAAIATIASTGVLVYILGNFETALNEYRKCRANVSDIGNAFNNYIAKRRTLPSAYTTDRKGQPLLSWRVPLLPFTYTVDRRPASQIKLDEPWNSKHNRALEGFYAPLFHCPNDPAAQTQTSYVAVIGPTTAFRGKIAVAIPQDNQGQTHTILAVETVQSGIHWMEPRDMPFKDAIHGVNVLPEGGIASRHAYPSLFGGDSEYIVNAACRDGGVMQLRSGMDPTVLRRLLELNDPKPPFKH